MRPFFFWLVKNNSNAVKYINSDRTEWDLPENSFAVFRSSIQGERDQARVIAGKHYLELLRVGLKGRQEANTLGCDWLWRSYRPGPGKRGLRIPLITVMGRKTLPANQIAELFAKEHGSENQQLRFVYFLDGREKQKKAFVADEKAFLQSHRRTKWDVLLK